MNLRTSEPEELEVNLTSLIDVVFLLLIFFMVSTTFERPSQLQIDLPEASANPVDELTGLELAIDAGGRMFLDGEALVNNRKPTLAAALQARLQGLGSAAVDTPVVLRADAETPHQYVIRAMDVLGAAGFSNLSIATTPESDQAQPATRELTEDE